MTDDELLKGLAANWTRYNRTRQELKAILAALPKKAAAARARTFAKKARGHRSEQVRAGVFVFCLPVILAALPSKTPLPAELDEFVILASPYESLVQKIVGRIPPARRLPIFEREIARGELHDVERITKRHLGLAPDATRAVLAYFERMKRARAGLALIADYKNPRIRKLARAYAEQIGKSPFVYTEPKVILLSDYAKLDDIAKAQWRSAASAYCGRKVKDPGSFVKALEKDELDAGDAEMRRWKVLRGRTHAYDLWVVWVENGSFFEAGTKERLPVHIVQGTFEALEQTDAMITLASDLGAASAKSLWPVPKKRGARST